MSNLSYRQPKAEIEPTDILVRTVYAHEGYVSSVTFFGPDYDQVLTGSYDETAKLWDLKNGHQIRKFQGHTDGVTFAMAGPDGRILTASEDRTFRVWDADTGDCLRVVRSHSGSVTSLCMAGPDRIVSGCSDKKLRVFDINGHLCGETELDSEIQAVVSPPPSVQKRRPPHGGDHGGGGRGSSRGGSRISGGGRRGDTELFRTDSQRAAPTPPTPPVVRILACGGTYIPGPHRPMLRIVDVETKPRADAVRQGAAAADGGFGPDHADLCAGGGRRSEYDDDGERKAAKEAGMMMCVAISSAGAGGRGILVTGCYDKGVRMLHNVLSSDRDDGGCNPPPRPLRSASSPPSGQQNEKAAAAAAPPPVTMRMLGRHREGVRSVAISADGRWAVSGDRGGTIKVWEIPQEAPPSGKEAPREGALAEFEAHRGTVFALCMSPDARTVVSGGSDRVFRVWDLSLIVYSRRMGLNRLRALWTAGRLRRARQRRGSGGSGSSRSSMSPRRRSGGEGGGGGNALKAFEGSKEQRQQILEGLFALPEIIYAKILTYL